MKGTRQVSRDSASRTCAAKPADLRTTKVWVALSPKKLDPLTCSMPIPMVTCWCRNSLFFHGSKLLLQHTNDHTVDTRVCAGTTDMCSPTVNW